MPPIIYVILCLAPVALVFAIGLCQAAARADEMSAKVLDEMEAKHGGN